MPRRISPKPSSARRHTIACLGDSLTHNLAYGVLPHLLWPEQLASLLRADGCAVRARNFGRAGNITGPRGGTSLGPYLSTVASVSSTTSLTIGSGLGCAVGDPVYCNGQWSTVAAYTAGSGALTLSSDSPINGMLAGMPFAWMGATAADMLSRLPMLVQYDTPDIAILFGGVNDPGNLWDSSTAPTKGVNTTDVVLAGSTQSKLIVNGANAAKFQPYQAVIVGSGSSIQWSIIASISGSGPYTLTLMVPLANGPTISASVGQGTQQNLQFMAQWLVNGGVPHVVICSSHCLNYPGGKGDFSSAGALSPGGSAINSQQYLALRPYLQAAAQASYTPGPNGGQVVYADLFNGMAAAALAAASSTSGGSTGANPLPAPYNQITLPGKDEPYQYFTAGAKNPDVTYTLYPGTAECSPSRGGYNWHVAAGQISTSSITSGGTGYAVNDIFTVTGGKGSSFGAQVTAVSSGAITAYSVINPGTGYVAGDLLSVSGGSGSGAQLTVSAVTAPNQHMNEIGEYLIAQIIHATINAQLGWATALKS